MASRQWFIGRNGKQEGPYRDERLRELIAGGIVTAETLVWSQGMNTWAKASEVPGLMSGAPRPPAATPGSVAVTGDATGALSTSVRVWPLLGRSIVVFIAQLTVIPAPWVLPSFYRWFVDQIELPAIEPKAAAVFATVQVDIVGFQKSYFIQDEIVASNAVKKLLKSEGRRLLDMRLS